MGREVARHEPTRKEIDRYERTKATLENVIAAVEALKENSP